VPHKNLSVEHRPAIAVENTFVELMTDAARLFMVNDGMRVGMLVCANNIKTIDPAFSSLVIKDHGDVVPR
jgi:hypothetical protein